MRAYSIDLREKIVEAVRRGMPNVQAARTLGLESLPSNITSCDESLGVPLAFRPVAIVEGSGLG
jgi:hypothetical protein